MKNSDMPAMPILNAKGFCAHPASGAIDQGTCAGLTKREAFAMAAMQGLLAGGYCIDDPIHRFEDVSDEAIGMADRMIEELERTK